MEKVLGSLPESQDAIEGGTNGALGGCSTADLKRGYSKPKADDSFEMPDYIEGGFCGRPMGWQR